MTGRRMDLWKSCMNMRKRTAESRCLHSTIWGQAQQEIRGWQLRPESIFHFLIRMISLRQDFSRRVTEGVRKQGQKSAYIRLCVIMIQRMRHILTRDLSGKKMLPARRFFLTKICRSIFLIPFRTGHGTNLSVMIW